MKRHALALLALGSVAHAQATVAVDPTADVHAISPLIYGVNFGDPAQLSTGNLTLTRWGGNSVTRYNYQTDVHNTGFDYFFENLPGCWGNAGNYCNPIPTNPQDNSGANAFLADAAQRNVMALFTVGTIGWTPKPPAKYNHPFDCGCVATGWQFDPFDTACGNGQQSMNGPLIACPAPTSTSVAVDANWTRQWVTYLVGRFGPANGKRIYALDNEPNLWSSTHHDVHPQKLTYDELWQKMRDNAVAILAVDPTAEISGPAEWGWPNYFCSDADNINAGCFTTSPDRAAHGGVDLTSWLLDQARAYEQQNGKRILHYLDLHYYPQGGNPPAVTRSLWDPSYTDPSWINDKIYLVPRMKQWVAQHYPGTKTLVSEYDFYHHDEAVGAVTYAEVLGIFGREGLDAATAWGPPASNEMAFAAFKLYRNYDGAGGRFGSTNARATVTNGNNVKAFAATGTGRLTVVLVNEGGTSQTIAVSMGSFAAGTTAQWYVRTTGSTIAKQPDVPVTSNSASVTLGATSIGILVVNGSAPPVDGGVLPDLTVPPPPIDAAAMPPIDSAGSPADATMMMATDDHGTGDPLDAMFPGDDAPLTDDLSAPLVPSVASGCGCHTGARPSSAPVAAALLSLSLLALALRRRR